jgi:hypothetical protein
MEGVPLTDFLNNLYAELVGIVVTVLGVSGLLTWLERRRWRAATQLIYDRLVRITNAVCAVLGDALGFHIQEFDYDSNRIPPSALEGSRIFVEAFTTWLAEGGESGITTTTASWSNKDWHACGGGLTEAREELLNVMSIYGGRLDNEITAKTLGLLEQLDFFLRSYEIFPELWGLSASEMIAKHPNVNVGFIEGVRLELSAKIPKVVAASLALKAAVHTRLGGNLRVRKCDTLSRVADEGQDDLA